MSDARHEGLVERVLATTTARVGASVLAFFVTLAAFAPLVANDRPLWIRAVDLGSYEAARTTLVPVVEEWAARVRAMGEAAGPGASIDGSAAVALQRRAVDVRLATMRAALEPEDARVLDELERALSNASSRPHGMDERGLDERGVDESGANARAAAERAVRALVPRSLTSAPSSASPSSVPSATSTSAASPTPAEGGVTLRARASSPLLAAWPAVDVAWAVGWLVMLLGFVIRRARGRTVNLVRLLVPAIVAFALVWGAWRPLVGPAPTSASYKAAIASGDLVVESVTFTLVPYGPAETNLSEAYRAPTWLSRAPSGSRLASTLPGFEAEALPVRVLPGEPPEDALGRHWLGTDSVGRDLFARIAHGARTSLFAGFVSAALLTCLGVLLGAWAGWRGGFVDACVSRVLEVVLCFPAFVLVLCAVFFVDPRVVPPLVSIALVIGLVGWPGVARLVRAECLRLRELEFVAAARALGLAERVVLWRHVLPHALPPAIVAFSFAVGSGVLAESALSFLGFAGAADQPSWGALVADSKSPDHAWIWIFPGACVFALVVSVNLVGEALRDAWDPRRVRVSDVPRGVASTAVEGVS